VTRPEPEKEWQDRIHQRMLQLDATAFAELCQVALPHLTTFLERAFPQQRSHMRDTVAVDLLLSYQNRPEQYDPDKLSLFAYLRMAVKQDMLNAIDSRQRRERRLINFDQTAVELWLSRRNNICKDLRIDEWWEKRTDSSFEDILIALRAELTPTDEQVLLLMLEGTRDSQPYAEVMGISHLEIGEQRREVKRAKDRLKKRLKRLRRSI
jgi:hypothetical protein